MDNKILIPVDFTSVAKTAISYAVKIAPQMKASIHLLHIVKEHSDINKAQAQLNSWVSDVDYDGQVEGSVRVGTIFEDISDFAAEEKAKLVIMGTHGKKGMQKITGSWAIKIINGSKVPYIVVQDKPAPDSIKDIVFPVDMEMESKEKLKVTAYYAKLLGSTIHMYVHNSKDKFDSAKINANVKTAKQFFQSNNVEYKIVTESGNEFVDDLLHYTVANSLDMIAIVNLNYKNFTNIFGNREEDLLFNDAQLPILIVNPDMDHMYSKVLQNF